MRRGVQSCWSTAGGDEGEDSQRHSKARPEGVVEGGVSKRKTSDEEISITSVFRIRFYSFFFFPSVSVG